MVAFVSVDLDASGGGTATVDDDRRPIAAEDLPAARTAAMSMLVQVARQRAGVRARVSDPEGAYMLELDRRGAVRATRPARPSRAARPGPAPTTARQTSSDVATPPTRAERGDEDYDLTDVDDAPPVEPDDDLPPGARSVVEPAPLPRSAEHVPAWAPLAPAEPDDRDDARQEQPNEAGTAATVTLDDTGGGDVVIGERTVRLAHGTLTAARRAAIDLLADVAAETGQAVRALVEEPAGRFLVDVDQDGDVTPVREEVAVAPGRRGRWRLRARTVTTLAAAALFAAVMLWPAPSDRSSQRAVAGAAASEQARADQREREWITTRQGAARTAASAQVLAGHRFAARAALDAARATLEGAPQAEDAVRAHLSALVDQVEAHLTAGASLAIWRDLVRLEIPAAEQAVRDSQAAWQAAEDDRIANNPSPSPAASSGDTQGAAAPTGGADNRVQPSSPRGQQAPPAAPGGGGGSSWTHVEANPLSTTSAEVGIARVRITVSGTETVTVVLTIAGTSVTVGIVACAGTLTGEISGLPAGSHAWSVTSGSATATGPPIRVF